MRAVERAKGGESEKGWVRMEYRAICVNLAVVSCRYENARDCTGKTNGIAETHCGEGVGWAWARGEEDGAVRNVMEFMSLGLLDDGDNSN